ncbi:MAG: dockerin type I domain-containing protein [Pirellulales bacterium]
MRNLKNHRRLVSEQLEGRSMMAGDLSHNFLEPNDVNDDDRVSPVDALLVINTLNDIRGGNSNSTNSSHFEDVNDDSIVSPSDALLIINQLTVNQTQSSNGSSSTTSQIEARMQSASSSAAAKIEFEQSGNEMELSIKLRDGAPSTTYPVHLNDFALGELITDARGRGMLKFASGDDSDHSATWPANMPTLTVDTELIIGDIVRAKLSGASVDDSSNSNGGSESGSGDDSDDSSDSNDDNSSDDNSSDDSNDSSSDQQSGNWIAAIANVGSLVRKAEFETETEDGVTKSKLEVEIEGAQPNATFAVSLAGVDLGEVQTNSRGKAKVVWSSETQSDQTLPTDLPTIGEGTLITIGDAQTSFHAA